MKIVEYKASNNVTIEFQDNYKTRVNVQYNDFKFGKVKNNFSPSVSGMGYIGNTTTRFNGKEKQSYNIWKSLILRCYDSEFKEKYPTYKNCLICQEWLSYENFEEWYDKNYYHIANERMCIDKDILYKGNKLYSSNTCVFVPHNINCLFVKRDKTRGNYPIGVSYHKEMQKYISSCNNGFGKLIFLGYYNTAEEAYLAYKEYKLKLIITIANNYKELIPDKLYKAMINYKVEITD